MARRGYDRRRGCAEDGCREVRITNYGYKRDYADAVRREKAQPPWKCLRHSRPEQVLGVHNLEVISECGRVQSEGYGTPRWEGAYHGGWATGPGFMAWAEDFPLGTRLIITARIELPAGYTPPEPPPSPQAPAPEQRFATDVVDLDR